jgi:hypothetical protein
MADSRIKSVSDLISTFFDRDLAAKGESYGNFRSAWSGIAGERLADHSEPVDIRHGVLIVETEHQGWTQLLQFQQERMLEEIRRRFPELEIRSIAWRLAAEPAAGRASGRAAETASGLAAGSIPEPGSIPVFKHVVEELPADAPAERADSEQSGSPAASLPPEIRAAFERLRKKSRER